jgi:hypothetical protein
VGDCDVELDSTFSLAGLKFPEGLEDLLDDEPEETELALLVLLLFIRSTAF